MNKKGKTVVKPEKTKAVFGRVIRAYFDGLTIKGINQHQVYVKGLDYSGNEVSGVFKRDFIKKRRLKVRVYGILIEGLNSNENWAWVKPIGGSFENNEKGVSIREMNLHYPISYRKLVYNGKYQEQLKKSK